MSGLLSVELFVVTVSGSLVGVVIVRIGIWIVGVLVGCGLGLIRLFLVPAKQLVERHVSHRLLFLLIIILILLFPLSILLLLPPCPSFLIFIKFPLDFSLVGGRFHKLVILTDGLLDRFDEFFNVQVLFLCRRVLAVIVVRRRGDGVEVVGGRS